jgi:hypothetical protein
MRRRQLERLETKLREDAKTQAREAMIAGFGPQCAAWLVFKERRRLHRRGMFDVVVDYRTKEIPMWFSLAVAFLRTRPGWRADEIKGKHARRFRIVWEAWMTRARGNRERMDETPETNKVGILLPLEEVSKDAKIGACARAAHEANRAYCLALGDGSQPPWENAPDWQRNSAVQGVHGVLAGNGPSESHAGWLAQKEADGWKLGPVKDPAKKEHPCMKSYDELPREQRRKDSIFVGTVRAMLYGLGFDLPPLP